MINEIFIEREKLYVNLHRSVPLKTLRLSPNFLISTNFSSDDKHPVLVCRLDESYITSDTCCSDGFCHVMLEQPSLNI